MPQVKICKIRRTEKRDVKEVYSTKRTKSQAGPGTPLRCLKSGWESASEAWPFQLIGDKAAKALDLAEGAAMQARERHRPHPRASPSFSTTPHRRLSASQSWAPYYLYPFWPCPPWARYVDTLHRDCAPLTWPGLERCRLLLWRRDMQRRHGLLRREMR